MTIEMKPIIVSESLAQLKQELLRTGSTKEKLELVVNHPTTKKFLSHYPDVEINFSCFTEKEKVVLYTTLALGQGERLFLCSGSLEKKSLKQLAHFLLPVEEFYQEFGGIVGYHVMCLELVAQKETIEKKGNYHTPSAYDLTEENPVTLGKAHWGLTKLSVLIYIKNIPQIGVFIA